MVLDIDGVNIALNKPANASDQYISANPLNVFTPALGCDGIVDQAQVPLNLVHAAVQGAGWWQVDLQGLYTPSRIIFFNRLDGEWCT